MLIRLTTTVLFIISSLASGAESPPSPGKEMALDDCVKIALEKNPTARAAAEDIVSSGETVSEARAPYYPELKANASYSRWQTRAFLPSGLLPPTAPSVIGPTDDYKAQGTLRLLLLDSGERSARLKMAKAQEGISGDNFKRTKQDLILNVHESFFRLAASLEMRSVATQNVARSEAHLKLAQDRQSAGASPQSDVLRAKVAVSEAKLDLVRANGLVRINMGSLNTAMGLPVETQLVPRTAAMETAAPAETSASSLLGEALLSRPEIKIARKRVDAARSAVTMAKSEYGPKVRAEGAYGLRDDSSDLEDKEYAAGISLEIPLFSGFSTKHKVAGKKAELSKTEAEAEAVVLLVQLDVWTAKSKLLEAEESLETADSRVKDARESNRITEERYKVGGCTITDLLDTQTGLAKAEAGKIEAEWNVRIAKSVLARSTGTLASAERK